MIRGRKPNGSHDATVARLWPDHSAARIAGMLRLVPRTVERIADRLGLPTKDDPNVEIRRQWGLVPARVLAELLRMSENAVRARAARMRLPMKRRGPMTGMGRHGTYQRWREGCGCGRCEVAGQNHHRLAQARARGAPIEQLEDGTVLIHPKPRRVWAAWRCPCDAYQIQQGATCRACGAAPPWANVDNQRGVR